jgi:hypothetical protein
VPRPDDATISAKETYVYSKRDLHVQQKRPTISAKETRGVCLFVLAL